MVSGGALRQTERIETVTSFDESYHLGTYAVLTAIPPQRDLRFEVDATYLGQNLADDIGIMFRYQNPNNYYRFSMNSRYGFSRLEKRIGGTFSTLAANARGFPKVGTPIRMAVALKGSSIQIFVNGDPLFAAEDSSLDSGALALYTQDDSRFDNVLVEPIGSSPSVVLATPTAHSVDTDDRIDARAVVINAPTGSYVEFSLDGGIPKSDATPPYSARFNGLSRGFDHTVVAVLRDRSGNELDRDTNIVVGAKGDRYIGIGDSITNGSNDNYAGDNISASGRVLGFRGYAALTTDLLDAAKPFPNLIVNEGVGGAKTSQVLANIDSVIERNLGSNKALILLGTNDSAAVTLGVPSGAGCSGSACNGTFKGNMLGILDSLPSNMTSTVALIPPAFGARSSS